MDCAASDWVARTGGEEFAVVLPDTAGREARAIADRLCARINSLAIPGLRQSRSQSPPVSGSARWTRFRASMTASRSD